MNNPTDIQIIEAHQELQLEIQKLRVRRKECVERKGLYIEIATLKKDIANAGGDELVNFQNDILAFLEQTWKCTAFVCGGVLDVVDKCIEWSDRIEAEERRRSKSMRRAYNL